MTYEERQAAVCKQCHSQRAIECGFVSRGLENKCSYLQDVMDGWELGQQDTKEAMMKDAVEATLWRNNLIRQKKITHPLHVGDKVKLIIIKED